MYEFYFFAIKKLLGANTTCSLIVLVSLTLIHIVQKKSGLIEVKKKSSPIEIIQEEDDIEKQKSNNKKYGLIMERTTRIEDKGMNPSATKTIQKKNLDIIDEDKEKGMIRKGMIRKGIVKEMLEKIERQNNTICKELDIKGRYRKRKTKEYSSRTSQQRMDK